MNDRKTQERNDTDERAKTKKDEEIGAVVRGNDSGNGAEEP